MFRLKNPCALTFTVIATSLLAGPFRPASALAQALPSELPLACSAYASTPLPPEAGNVSTPKEFPACASYRSYRGIGRPVNYQEARSCAWQERLAQKADLGQNAQEPGAWIVGGSLILADIYLNGTGVKRNIPLAVRFACESEEGMAELALPEIAKRKELSRAGDKFEFCDYAATTITMNFCSGYQSEIEDDRRERYYNSLKSSMTPEQRSAFEKLLATEKAYIKAHANEVDQGGTIREMRTLNSQGILEDGFHTDLVQFERKKWPVFSEAQTQMADAMLEREYEKELRQLRAQPPEEIDGGGVTAGHLSRVERAWKTYRDAWVAFAHLRYPDASDTIRTKITLDRYRLLKTLS